MSGGTPTAGGYMRQRHSQGYASSGDDLEDDACSRPPTPQSSPFQEKRTWVEIVENLLWLASAVFIVYYGDSHFNFIYLLLHDDRIRRIPLYLGLLGVSLIIIFFLYTSMLIWGVRKSSEKWEISSTAALPFITILGFISFSMFCCALWPIWSFLTLPLVFTLFMACMVILPFLLLGTVKPQADDMLRTD